MFAGERKLFKLCRCVHNFSKFSQQGLYQVIADDFLVTFFVQLYSESTTILQRQRDPQGSNRKFASTWGFGSWLDRVAKSDMHVVGARQGNFTAPTIRRLPALGETRHAAAAGGANVT